MKSRANQRRSPRRALSPRADFCPPGAATAANLDASQERLLSCFSLCSACWSSASSCFSAPALSRATATATLFFREDAGVWLGVGLVVCIVGGAGRLPFLAAHLVDLVRPRPRRARALFRAAFRDAHQWFAPLGRLRSGSRFSPRRFAKLAVVFFLACWFARYEKESSRICAGFRHSARRSSRPLLAAHRDRGRSRHDRADRRDHVCRHVRRRNAIWRFSACFR